MANSFFETLVEVRTTVRAATRAVHAAREDMQNTVRASRRMINESHALIAEVDSMLEDDRTMWPRF